MTTCLILPKTPSDKVLVDILTSEVEDEENFKSLKQDILNFIAFL